LAPEGPGMWVGLTWSMGDPLRGKGRAKRGGRRIRTARRAGIGLAKHTPNRLEACSGGPRDGPRCATDGFAGSRRSRDGSGAIPGARDPPRSFTAREEAAPPESGTAPEMKQATEGLGRLS